MRFRWLALVLGALAYGAALVFIRGEPRWNGDQGVFLSIAARVLDGDRLYADVIDNKDPLFFYAHAGALWIGGWKGPAALDGLWFAVAALSIALLLRALDAPPAAVVAGFFVYPLALTASWYEPGLSMLGGLALAPLVPLFWVKGRFLAAGVALGVVLAFKITVTLVAAAPLVAFLALRVPSGAWRAQLARVSAGFLGCVGVLTLVLAVRGELVRYVEVLSFNVRYPDAARRVQGSSGGIASHLTVVREFFLQSGRWQWSAALLTIGLLAAVTVYAVWRRTGYRVLAVAALAVATGAVVTLALTAIWFHHLQMLAFPAALAAAVAIAALSVRSRRAGLALSVALVAFAFWASFKQEVRVGDVGEAWTGARSSVGADLLEAARLRYRPADDDVTYVVFGSNSENAHAVFIDDAFDLQCRWFHLYPNNLPEHLEETLGCARRKSPELVLVTVGFFEPRGAGPEWDAFVGGARTLLEERYEKVADQDMFQVWKRMDVA